MSEIAAARRFLCYPILADSDLVAHYGRELGLANPEAALRALARAVAGDPGWSGMPECVLLVRPAPRPALAVIGAFNAREEAWLEAQARGLRHGCARLRYVDYARIEQDCAGLAAQLVERFGGDAVGQFRFTAIPRGGLIVLGILAYLLRLDRAQLQPPYPAEAPLVVVDDCAFTGARFRRFLASCASPQVIFAPLYSHPELRAAITAQESRVLDCLSAHDLHDHGPEQLGDEYPLWRKRWREQLDDLRYWVGLVDHVCFAWNEPDRSIWDSVAARDTGAWHIVPPERCVKNWPMAGGREIPVQFQPGGRGPLRPTADVLFGEFQERIVIGNIRTGETLGLADVAADIWRAVVEYGHPESVLDELRKTYDVDAATLQADLSAFINKLLVRGLLEQGDAPDHGL